jgi:polysaccharide export outer membrane protein
MMVIGSFGCAGRDHTPYRTEDIPRADYEGRPESRRFRTSQMDPVTSMTLASLHFPKPELPKLSKEEAAAAANAGYQLGPGDVLEIIYQLKSERSTEPYRLEVLDGFKVEFMYTPNLDTEVFVRQDGKVNLPMIGDMQAAGRTTEELRDELNEAFKGELRDPAIRVFVTRSNNAIEELKRAITTAPRGQSRLTPVRPDGYISLPLIGDIKAAGHTIPYLSTEIVARYREASVRNIDATVVLLEVKAPVVYVMGEVTNPGPLVLSTPTDIWRAVGLAGGFIESSNTREVVLARTTDGKEGRYKLNFNSWSSGLDPDENVELKRGDVVYVPKEAGRYVYVMGEVEKPGRVQLEPGEQMRVSQALAMTGRIRSSALKRRVLLLSSNGNEPVVTQVNLKEIMHARHYEQKGDYPPRDPIVKPGDVVYVTSSGIGDFNTFAENWFRNGVWTVFPFIATYSLN